jgi:hypothetical protein
MKCLCFSDICHVHAGDNALQEAGQKGLRPTRGGAPHRARVLQRPHLLQRLEPRARLGRGCGVRLSQRLVAAAFQNNEIQSARVPAQLLTFANFSETSWTTKICCVLLCMHEVILSCFFTFHWRLSAICHLLNDYYGMGIFVYELAWWFYRLKI